MGCCDSHGSYAGDYFTKTKHDIRIRVKQPGFNEKHEFSFFCGSVGFLRMFFYSWKVDLREESGFHV